MIIMGFWDLPVHCYKKDSDSVVALSKFLKNPENLFGLIFETSEF
jgi:hypothetical protein